MIKKDTEIAYYIKKFIGNDAAVFANNVRVSNMIINSNELAVGTINNDQVINTIISKVRKAKDISKLTSKVTSEKAAATEEMTAVRKSLNEMAEYLKK